MKIKEKFIGLVLVAVGALPFLLELEAVSDFFDSYSVLSWFMPGATGYQVLIIVLGVWLIWSVRAKVDLRR